MNSNIVKTMMAWPGLDMDDAHEALVSDFEAHLSGLGSEIGTGAYNMSELLNVPIIKQESVDLRFQYVLMAATSPSCKVNEETLTYLNQGQGYELRLKKIGNKTEFGTMLKSVVRVLFYERRLQFMENEQLGQWTYHHPGERIVQVDMPNCVGIYNLTRNHINSVEFVWEPTKETSVSLQIHCISTEFTARKHGGEKGVPFRLQIDTYRYSDSDVIDSKQHLSSACCQIKVFKPKGADRKHRLDRDKMDKRLPEEQQKYQPPYDCTILSACSLVETDMSLTYSEYQYITPTTAVFDQQQQQPCSNSGPPHGHTRPYESSSQYESSDPASPASGDVLKPKKMKKSLSFTDCSEIETSAIESPSGVFLESPPPGENIVMRADVSCKQVTHWLQANRFASYHKWFNNFTGADMLKLCRNDCIQICGPADGIRLFNSIQSCVKERSVESSPAGSPSRQQSPTSLQALENQPLQQDASVVVTQQWLMANRLTRHTSMLNGYSGSDLHCLTRTDLTQICGVADGIRLHNLLHSRTVKRRTCLYVCLEDDTVYNPVFLEEFTLLELKHKLSALLALSTESIPHIYKQGPTGIQIHVTDEMVKHFRDETCFVVNTINHKNGNSDMVSLILVQPIT